MRTSKAKQSKHSVKNVIEGFVDFDKINVTTVSAAHLHNFFVSDIFFRPDPQGREIAVYWGVWPIFRPLALRGIPGARGRFGGEIRTPKQFLPETPHPFYIQCFPRPDAHRRGITIYWVLGHLGSVGAFGTWRSLGRCAIHTSHAP